MGQIPNNRTSFSRPFFFFFVFQIVFISYYTLDTLLFPQQHASLLCNEMDIFVCIPPYVDHSDIKLSSVDQSLIVSSKPQLEEGLNQQSNCVDFFFHNLFQLVDKKPLQNGSCFKFEINSSRFNFREPSILVQYLTPLSIPYLKATFWPQLFIFLLENGL